MTEKLDKINLDIENGLKSKAADRLRNLIQENPNELEIWNRLAELYYESGFLDAAGKSWILIEPTDERIKKCVAIYEKSVNNSGYQILQDIVYRGDKSELPKYAQEKLNQLETDSKQKANYIPKFNPKTNKQKRKNSNGETSFSDRIGQIIFFSILISIGLLLLVGLGTVIGWII